MGQSTYFLTLGSAGNVTGSGFTPDGTIPPGAIICTETEAQNSARCTVSGTTVTLNPAPAPTLAQQAAAALGAGLAITSTGTPAINGTYAIASGIPFGREDIGTEAQFVSTFSEFTNGAQTLEWPLLNGTFVTFPSTASFMNFAKAAAQYYAAVKAVVAAGQGSFPSNQVTIP